MLRAPTISQGHLTGSNIPTYSPQKMTANINDEAHCQLLFFSSIIVDAAVSDNYPMPLGCLARVLHEERETVPWTPRLSHPVPRWSRSVKRVPSSASRRARRRRTSTAGPGDGRALLIGIYTFFYIYNIPCYLYLRYYFLYYIVYYSVLLCIRI